MRLLGGIGRKAVKGVRRGSIEEDEEEEIEREEIRRAVRNLKEGKASEIYGIPGEVWKYGEEEMEGWIEEFCNRVWKEKNLPEE